MPPAWVESSSIDRFSMQRMKLVSSTIKCQLDWHSARYLAARDVSEPGRSNNVHSTPGHAMFNLKTPLQLTYSASSLNFITFEQNFESMHVHRRTSKVAAARDEKMKRAESPCLEY